MFERPEKPKGKRPPEDSELRERDLQALLAQQAQLDGEMEKLVAEEGELIARPMREADFARIKEILAREIEIVDEQRRTIEVVARLCDHEVTDQ